MNPRRWYAFDAIDDSLYNIRYYFVPFNLWRYAALVIVTSVVGARAGYGAFGDVAAVLAGVEADLRLTQPAAELAVEYVDLFVVAVALLVLLVFVSAVFEFVFVDLLVDDDLRIRKLFRRRWREGGALFLFRVTITAAFFGSSYVAVGLYRNAEEPVAPLFLLAAIVALLALAFSILNGLTTDFAVPIMVVDDRGLPTAWIRLANLLRADPRQFGVYVVLRGMLNAIILVGATVVSVFIGTTLGLPLAGVGYAAGLTSSGLDAVLATAAGLALAIVLVVIYVVLLLLMLAVFVQLPIRFFLRVYPIYVLGYADEKYAVLEPRPADITLLDFLLGRK